KGLLVDSEAAGNTLEFVDIRGGGGGAFNSNNDISALVIWADTKLTIRSCQILESGGYGISAIYTNSNWSIEESLVA
ncbi:MAG: hypothetical protein AAFU60_14255, partial [Bacteroidota bacterium]